MSQDAILIIAIIIGFPIFFGALWTGVMYFNSFIGGWYKLANIYREDKGEPEFDGKMFHMQSARISWVNYSGVLSIGNNADTLRVGTMIFFRAGHPFLRIPLKHVSAEEKLWFLWRGVQLRFDNCPNVSLMIRKKLADQLIEASGNSWAYKPRSPHSN